MANYIPLVELRKITGISPSTIYFLLESASIKCKVERDKVVLVDAEDITEEKLKSALTYTEPPSDRILMEKIAKIIKDNLELILEEAIEKAAGGSPDGSKAI